MAASSSDVQRISISDFDFYNFEEEWITNADTAIGDDIRETLYEIFHVLFEEWNSYLYDRNTCEYFVGLGAPRSESMGYLLENIRDSNIIFPHRDPRGCIASKAQKVVTSTALDILRTGRLYNVLGLHKTVKQLKNEYPERVHIVGFEDLILENTATMQGVRQFMNIKHDPIL